MNHNRRARGRMLAGIAAAVLIFANVSDGFRFAQANNEDKTEGQGAEEGVITAFPQLQRNVTFVAGKTAPKSIEEFLGDTISVTVKETDRKKVESAAGRTSASQETDAAAGGTSLLQETESAESQMSVDPEIKPEEQETAPAEVRGGDSEAEPLEDGSKDKQTTVTKQVKITWAPAEGSLTYRSEMPGTYLYKGTIEGNYKLQEGLDAPEVKVTVQKAEGGKIYLKALAGQDEITLEAEEGALPEGATLLAGEVKPGLAGELLSLHNRTKTLTPFAAYDIKVVKDGKKAELSAGQDAKITIRSAALPEQTQEPLYLYHVKQDLMDDEGRPASEAEAAKVLTAVKNGQTQVEKVPVTREGNTLSFALSSFSTVIVAGSVPSAATKLDEVYIKYNGVKYDLKDAPAKIPNFGYKDQMTLHVAASFGAGTDKTISITLPEGLSFREDVQSSRHYVVNGTDATLAGKTISGVGADILGERQYNGTLTLRFHGQGESNDAKAVAFDVPIYSAWRNSRNGGLWESGTAWFYDKLPNSKVTEAPVVVKQSITNPDGSQTTNQNQLDELTMKNEEEKAYGKSWNSPLIPEIKEGGQMSGNESFWVKPLPNGGTYTNPTAYQEYSITYLAPEKAVFKGFKNPNPGSSASATPDYNGAPCMVTTPGNTTPDGKTVPPGYKAYTFTVRNEIISPKELTVYPMWSFPAADFPAGTKVKISVDDVKVRYYGREYGTGDYEDYDPSKYPSLTYEIKGEYEEVYALVNYQDSRRITDGKVYDSTLYMGAPGYEFNQERSAGYFFFGNRGLKDSATKQVTITYDAGNTGMIGVTQQRLPQDVAGDHTISNIKVKTWNPATGASSISGWIPYTGGRTLNLKDLVGISGNSGIYLKEITFQMDTIPARSLISDAASRDKNSYSNSESYLYRFHAKVLKGDAVAVTSERIENKIEIANVTPLTAPTAGDEKNSGEGQNSKYMTIVGRTFNGLQGKSLVLGNTLDYDPNNQVKAGEEGHVKSKVHFHAWTPQNAQLIDAIYLISPYGEDFTNIRMHYSRGGGFPIQNKKYLKDENAPQPNITEQPASDALRARYRDAKVYKLDFTGITDAQKKYDARLVGGNVLSQASLLNTPLSTDSQYNGSWISYDYKPKISDPYGTYSDLMWVEYYADTDKDVEYRREENHNVKLFDDIYKLLGDNPKKKLIGRMDPITILPTEELTVSSSAKKEQEVDSMYRTYDPRNPETIMKMRREANYKLRVQNFTSNPVTEFSVYFPIPKAGQDWGNTINPEGKFQYNNVLRHGLSRVPKGFRVYYAKNVNPTAHYENWDDENWTEQDATDRWSPSDWKEVNFVKMVWVGTDDHKAIVNQDDYQAVFDLGVDEGVTEAQMGKKNVWQPYFLRKYTNSTSWVAGEPVAAMLSPGIIKGTVWVDQNVNGVLNGKKDPGEEAAAGVKVQLYDVGNPVNPVLKEEVTTGANGAYRFEGLVNGNYSSGNQYKVVVNRDANTYSSFTIRGVNMVFKPDDDQNTASLEVSPAPETEEKSYDVGLVKPGIVMDAPIVHKKVTGANARPETFVFEWTAVPDPNTLPAGRSYLPMPNGLNAESVQASLQTGTEKEMTLGSLSFTQAGTYAYRLKEINTGAANYTYDETSYTITYEIRIDENTHQTIGKRTIERGGELLPAASACTFTNTYVAPGGGTTPGTSGETPGTNPGTPGIRGGSVPQGGDVLGARRGTEGKSEKPSLLDSPAVLGMRRALTGDGFDLAMHTGAAVLCSCAAVLLILAGGEQKKKGSR
ncbi:MAG: hypothetical protein HXK82_09345 [Lachnospiraceae bacterium]|nr:hypothetical protein [Lachnospiraceae bacterium]